MRRPSWALRAALESYFHRLLTTLGGWSQLARYRLWQAELTGNTDASVTDLLAIRLIWEAALLRKFGPVVEAQWKAAIAAYAEPVFATPEDVVDAILQEAAERAAQRRLGACLTGNVSGPGGRWSPHVADGILHRRALGSVSAGDGKPRSRHPDAGLRRVLRAGHRPSRFASDVVEARLPVLLKPGIFTCSGEATATVASSDLAARITARVERAWGRFKLAAISSFAFVEAAGPIYVAKLLRDGLGLKRHAAPNDPAPRPTSALDLNTRLTMAVSILKAMSLTRGFAKLVLLAGHGANVVNNPHASALHCGACGGYSGEVNARLLASVLNDREVRAGLAERGIIVPEDTLFLAALHDTTTDDVNIIRRRPCLCGPCEDVDQAERWLKSAGILARGERALRLPRAKQGQDIPHRARDWAELRPEWALAGCQALSRRRGHGLRGTIWRDGPFSMTMTGGATTASACWS